MRILEKLCGSSSELGKIDFLFDHISNVRGAVYVRIYVWIPLARWILINLANGGSSIYCVVSH